MLVSFITVIGVSGCNTHDLVNFLNGETTLYIPPASQLQIGETKEGYIYGTSDCNANQLSWLFGHNDQSLNASRCIKIEPNTQKVDVLIFSSDEERIHETWTVHHPRDGSIQLIRPNGYQVRMIH